MLQKRSRGKIRRRETHRTHSSDGVGRLLMQIKGLNVQQGAYQQAVWT